MKRKITLKDIAKELDVSISTVSKSLKNNPEIGEDTRQKVQAFAKLYNYKPNNIAVSLLNQRTKHIALIIPEITHDFFTTVLKGVEEVAHQRGYNVLVCVSNESFEKEVLSMEMFAQGGIVDGFIISLSKETQLKDDYKHLVEVENQGMPLVMIDRVTDKVISDKVIVDDMRGAYTAVSHLVEKGCRRIALITTQDHISVGYLRKEGYKKALADHDLAVADALIVTVDHVDEAEDKIRQLVTNETFDAVLGVNEIFAVIAMKLLQEAGKRIPDEVAIIGFSDGKLLKYATPSITAVDQHGVEIGKAAAGMLIERLESDVTEENFRTTVITTSLVERDSTNLN
ncbi:LacI family DNA-binding transcriptional regulator [Leeuwenhoekiella parthenopeia]|uniref:LacI family transcriptional regulator n=1 Tax=Leeuwenhoekiella parthenopeia TaxID=2890320 RepID=A0ABS8GQL6_9FLAO|nr:LacI family DNA-binding transcriptional regulator [Leeuwenhoekiella parthenopeia]MCC4212277.1 LacI family transcriptional regulator [Leeuwenhoekiella parthenopeia]